MKKCSVDLVTGFLSSGKTSFINIFLEKTLRREETIIIQCEDGAEHIDENIKNKFNVSLKAFSSNNELTEERLIRMIKFYKAERMIIECNGIQELDTLVKLFNTTKLKAYFRISGIITVLNALTFNMFLKNLGHIILPYIEKGDLIVLNKSDEVSEEVLKRDISIIKNLNNHAHILVASDKHDLKAKIIKAKVING